MGRGALGDFVLVRAVVLAGWVGMLSGATPSVEFPWGAHGHEIAARAAAATLPDDMPAFFREAADQLVYLDPEPDRWRSRALDEMDRAWYFDHYIDLENVPDGALDAPHRFAYLRTLYDAGLNEPESDGGFLPFRIVELYQRLVSGWQRWHRESNPQRRAWIEARIINDAGILGHYVTDASQPHHTTVHFNGWASGTANPEGFTEDRDFHSRFESGFVDEHLVIEDIASRLPGAPRSVAGEARTHVVGFVLATHEEVEALYRMERDVGFDPDRPAHPDAEAFTADRLAAGAGFLATLWWSAHLEGRDGG